jgi:hypothetical protein
MSKKSRVGRSGLIFFLLSAKPENFDVPPKMKVKGYMYPQMKKHVGILH